MYCPPSMLYGNRINLAHLHIHRRLYGDAPQLLRYERGNTVNRRERHRASGPPISSFAPAHASVGQGSASCLPCGSAALAIRDIGTMTSNSIQVAPSRRNCSSRSAKAIASLAILAALFWRSQPALADFVQQGPKLAFGWKIRSCTFSAFAQQEIDRDSCRNQA
jgi:hypothetical protein